MDFKIFRYIFFIPIHLFAGNFDLNHFNDFISYPIYKEQLTPWKIPEETFQTEYICEDEEIDSLNAEEDIFQAASFQGFCDQDVSFEENNCNCCTSWRNFCPLPKRLTLFYVDGSEAVCYETNYSSVAAFFAPDYCPGQILPFLDVRGHHFNCNLYGMSIGVGARYMSPCECRNEIFGFNMYYDYRPGFIGDFHLLGFGVEVLGRCWDFRANATFPVGKQEFTKICLFDQYDGDYFAVRQKKEFIFSGYNAEVGYRAVDSCDFLLYIAAGPYYWGSPSFNARGGRIRIRPQYKDYVALDFSVSYDTVFKTIYQGKIIFYVPLYEYPCFNKCRRCKDRYIYQPIERFEMIPIGKQSCWISNF